MNANSTKISFWKKATLLLLGVGLLTAGLSVYFQTQGHIAQGFNTESSKIVMSIPVPAKLADSALQGGESLVGTGSSFEMPGQPVRLLIPVIGVNAVIQSVGLSWKGDGTMGIPTNFTDVAWYNKGSLPGMQGSAVIAGHLDGKNVAKAVFYDLGSLKQGDLVEVIDKKGKTLSFQVVDIKTYDYNAPTSEVFSSDNPKGRLNLITCTGDWIKNQKIYNKRIVVFTELITAN